MDTGGAGTDAGGDAAGGADTGGGGVFSVGMATVRFSSWLGWELGVILSWLGVLGKPLTLI